MSVFRSAPLAGQVAGLLIATVGPGVPVARAADAAPGLPPAPGTSIRAVGEAHPLIGTWRWTRARDACVETYEFRTDGTLTVVSGRKRTENTYTVTRQPDAAGFYEMHLSVTQDLRGTDCGHTDNDDTGKGYTSFLLFEPSHGMYLSCAEPILEVCFGPLRRQGGTGL